MIIKINTGGAAFHSDENDELDRFVNAEQLRIIFNRIVSDIQDGKRQGTVNDVNGNKCCNWEV